MELTDRRYLGVLCKRGHEYENTGKSLRKKDNNDCVACASMRGRERYRTPEYRIKENLRRIEARAKEKNLAFDLTPSWFIANLPKTCPVFGVDLVWGHGANSPSVDRLIPERGYVQTNCYIISKRANTIKNNATLEELKAIVAYVEACDNV